MKRKRYYNADGKVICQICGKSYRSITKHLSVGRGDSLHADEGIDGKMDYKNRFPEAPLSAIDPDNLLEEDLETIRQYYVSLGAESQVVIEELVATLAQIQSRRETASAALEQKEAKIEERIAKLQSLVDTAETTELQHKSESRLVEEEVDLDFGTTAVETLR